jgi:hypothetical protein
VELEAVVSVAHGVAVGPFVGVGALLAELGHELSDGFGAALLHGVSEGVHGLLDVAFFLFGLLVLLVHLAGLPSAALVEVDEDPPEGMDIEGAFEGGGSEAPGVGLHELAEGGGGVVGAGEEAVLVEELSEALFAVGLAGDGAAHGALLAALLSLGPALLGDAGGEDADAEADRALLGIDPGAADGVRSNVDAKENSHGPSSGRRDLSGAIFSEDSILTAGCKAL